MSQCSECINKVVHFCPGDQIRSQEDKDENDEEDEDDDQEAQFIVDLDPAREDQGTQGDHDNI